MMHASIMLCCKFNHHIFECFGAQMFRLSCIFQSEFIFREKHPNFRCRYPHELCFVIVWDIDYQLQVFGSANKPVAIWTC
jgi:hypothetical protein